MKRISRYTITAAAIVTAGLGLAGCGEGGMPGMDHGNPPASAPAVPPSTPPTPSSPR